MFLTAVNPGAISEYSCITTRDDWLYRKWGCAELDDEGRIAIRESKVCTIVFNPSIKLARYTCAPARPQRRIESGHDFLALSVAPAHQRVGPARRPNAAFEAGGLGGPPSQISISAPGSQPHSTARAAPTKPLAGAATATTAPYSSRPGFVAAGR